MSRYETILLHRDPQQHIARITLNRPDSMNAINDQMQRELAEAVEEVAGDDEVRVVVLAGTGRSFCSGADTQEMVGGERPGGYASSSAEEVRRYFRWAQRVVLGLHNMEKPTIAMVNGPAVGAGFDLACACDLRIGSTSARFMAAYVRIGLFPGWGGTWLYPRVLGSVSKAAELLFTGDFLEAEEAHRLGFLNRLVPPEELEAATMEMARKVAAGPPIAIRLAKMMLYQGLQMDLETAMKMAASAETITLTSEDHREGIASFREKRKPNYKGR